MLGAVSFREKNCWPTDFSLEFGWGCFPHPVGQNGNFQGDNEGAKGLLRLGDFGRGKGANGAGATSCF